MADERPDHYDLLVIGAGPAGEKGAAQAAYFGKRVCIIERAPKPGGAAVNTGTVPSKTLRETALYFSGLKQRGLYGVDYTVKQDITIADFMFRERAVVDSAWHLIDENLKKHHVTTLQGLAQFMNPRTVEVVRYHKESLLVSANTILIATGSRPRRPDTIPFDDAVVVDSDSLLRLTRIPQRMVVVGGGVIGCEYACMFAALGVQVTLVNSRERLLTQLDAEVSEALRQRMTSRLHIAVHLNSEVTDVAVAGDVATVTLSDDAHVTADCVLYSIGREGNTNDLALDAAGVATNAYGYIQADHYYRTTAPHIYAAGDVIGFPSLAAASMEQARVAICHAFDLKYKQEVSPYVPYGVYTIPEISMVGETEESARAKGIEYVVGRASYRTNMRGQIIGDTEGFIKLLFRSGDQQLLGVSIIGESAAELIHIGMACLMYEGTLDFFIQSVFNYPSLSDVYKYAAYDGLQQLAKRVSSRTGLPRMTPAGTTQVKG